VVVIEDARRQCAEFLQDLGYTGYGSVANTFLYLTPEHAETLGYAHRA
jgi:hypothetical protein